MTERRCSCRLGGMGQTCECGHRFPFPRGHCRANRWSTCESRTANTNTALDDLVAQSRCLLGLWRDGPPRGPGPDRTRGTDGGTGASRPDWSSRARRTRRSLRRARSRRPGRLRSSRAHGSQPLEDSRPGPMHRPRRRVGLLSRVVLVRRSDRVRPSGVHRVRTHGQDCVRGASGSLWTK